MKILSLLNHPHVIPVSFYFIFTVKHKRWNTILCGRASVFPPWMLKLARTKKGTISIIKAIHNTHALYSDVLKAYLKSPMISAVQKMWTELRKNWIKMEFTVLLYLVFYNLVFSVSTISLWENSTWNSSPKQQSALQEHFTISFDKTIVR